MSEVRPEQSILKDRRMLSRLKLILWTVTVLLVLHALPGRLIKELYPVTRWAMFSEPQFYPSQYTHEYELDITDKSGAVHTVTASSLYSALVTNHYDLSSRIVRKTLSSEDDAVRAEYRRALIERITGLYGIEVSNVEIWRAAYPVDLSRLPNVDYSKPAQRDFLGEFTAEEIS